MLVSVCGTSQLHSNRAKRLDSGDAGELAEMLEFLDGWLGGDADCLGASVRRFVGSDGYGVAQLRMDLQRFVFLLGGSDGGVLFGEDVDY